jgi:hypothetical protein
MFVETITAPREEWEHWNERLRTLTERTQVTATCQW